MAVQAPAVLSDVPGWFWDHDRHAFDWFLGRQERAGVTGDLLELGAYLGRSAIVLGSHLQPGETFTVCDLFESDAPDEENSAEMTWSYRHDLTRRAFETNYLAFHDELPVIHQEPTAALADGRIPAASCRFVHVDASHLYEHVSGDIQLARTVLGEDGVLVLDDYRSAHTPGVAAATWEAVLNHGLRPVCLTDCKFYGTWGDPGPAQRELLSRTGLAEGCQITAETVAGHQVLRLDGSSDGIPEFPVSRHHARLTAEAEAAAADEPARPRPRVLAKRLARELLPPAATKAIRRCRAR